MRSYNEIYSDLKNMLEPEVLGVSMAGRHKSLLEEVIQLLEFQQSRIRSTECNNAYSMEDIIVELQQNTGNDLSLDLAQRAIDCMVDLRKWKDSLTDEAVIDWCLSDKNINDPRQMIKDIIAWNTMVALDPCVSEDAVKLRDTFRQFAEIVANDYSECTNGIEAQRMLEENK